MDCPNEDHGPVVRFHVSRMRWRPADPPNEGTGPLGGLGLAVLWHEPLTKRHSPVFVAEPNNLVAKSDLR